MEDHMDSLLHQQIGKRIFDRRKQLRLTQEALAELAGVTPQTISSAETGKKGLRPENIVKICTALEISCDYLLTGKITGDDYAVLQSRVSELSPSQYHYLENVIDNYLSAALEGRASGKDN